MLSGAKGSGRRCGVCKHRHGAAWAVEADLAVDVVRQTSIDGIFGAGDDLGDRGRGKGSRYRRGVARRRNPRGDRCELCLQADDLLLKSFDDLARVGSDPDRSAGLSDLAT